MALNILQTILSLFNDEDILDARIARAYKDAYEVAMEDDKLRARVFPGPATMKMKQAAEELSAQTPQGMTEAYLRTGFTYRRAMTNARGGTWWGHSSLSDIGHIHRLM